MICCLACSCSSVNIRTDSSRENYAQATFQKRYHYWWWGLKGKHRINVREICNRQRVMQMQAVSRASDILIAISTLGIYTTRTARVWCEEA